MKLLRLCMVFVIISCSLSGCLASGKDKRAKIIEEIDQLQLQEDMQRFYARFTSRVIESYSHDELLVKNYGMKLLQQYINYNTEALKIVSSPYPVANFLDMLIFVKLNKIVIHDYWIPKVYGEQGIPIMKVFIESEEDLLQLAQKFMRGANLSKVDELVNTWRLQNPDYIHVEKIRLSDFTEIGMIKEKEKNGFSISGIIVDTQDAVKAVDEALLVSNRAIFMAQNIPNLIRLQMRLGAQEVITDSISNLQSAPNIPAGLERTRPFIHDLTSLASESNTLVKDLESLLQLVRQKELKGIDVEKNLKQVDSILGKANTIVTTLHTGQEGREKAIKDIRSELRSLIFFIFLCLIGAGFFISLFWWIGHYLTKKRLSFQNNGR